MWREDRVPKRPRRTLETEGGSEGVYRPVYSKWFFGRDRFDIFLFIVRGGTGDRREGSGESVEIKRGNVTE